MSKCIWYCDVTDIYKRCAAPLDVKSEKTKRPYVIIDEFWNEKIKDILNEFDILMQPVPILMSEPLEGLAFPEFYVNNIKVESNFVCDYKSYDKLKKGKIYIWIKATCDDTETIKVIHNIVAKFGGFFVKGEEWIEISKEV